MIEQGGSRQGAQGLVGDGERDELELRLGRYAAAVQARLERWTAEDFGRRLWAKDHTLWSPRPMPELSDRLGWLKLPESMRTEMEDLARFGQSLRDGAREGIRDVVVLGMGGSSLAPEVFSRVFGSAQGFPALTVLDSTHPEAVRAVAERLDPTRSLFVVSSKSGGTAETLSLFRAFWHWAMEALASKEEAGRRFLAVTDPGTSLERLARERGFRAVFNAPEDVGGRYSALTNFGLVPAALIGVDLRGLLGRARVMAESCVLPVPENPGVRLGAALGELALAGRDKVTFLTSPRLASFPDWLEQLIAESTGKHGRGIVPVVGEPLGAVDRYGPDRFFVALLAGGPEDMEILARLGELERAGHPVARLRFGDELDLGREFFRWEIATAAAGAVLGVNPFDQPDVQLAKDMANQAMKAGASADESAGDAVPASDSGFLVSALQHWLVGAAPGADYVGLHAWLPAAPATMEALRAIQGQLRDRTGVAVTLGFGPRFLHSTGQLHKGGPATGRFLQLVDTPAHDLPVPETDYTFARLLRAQADGDRAALEQRGRSVLRVDLGADIAGGLAALREALGA